MITTYTLTYRGIERDTPLKVKILSVLNGSIYITPALRDLQEDTRYVISVRANTSVGAGPWTNLTVHTPEDGKLSNFSDHIFVRTSRDTNLLDTMSSILCSLRLFDDGLLGTDLPFIFMPFVFWINFLIFLVTEP